jgi:hypothetical protein
MSFARRAMAVPVEESSPQRSPAAEVLARCGNFSYWLALVFAALFLLAASAFSTLSSEPLWLRLMTLVFLGFLPALAFYLIGWLTSWTLKVASAIYELVAPFFRRTFRVVTNTALLAWRVLVWLAMDILPWWLGNVMAFLRACRLALQWAGRVTAFYGRAAARLFARACRYSSVAGRACIMGATFPVRLVARILIRLIPSAGYQGID